MYNFTDGKGANLAEMAAIKLQGARLPVPAGFTISTEVCTYFYTNGRQYPPELKAQVDQAMADIEKTMGKKFGDTSGLPLLVSCSPAHETPCPV